jgi:hypothetical protein
MLEGTSMVATLSGDPQGAVTKGCTQRGVWSPLMWRPVMDEFLGELNLIGYYAVRYAHDIPIPVNWKFPSVVSEVLRTALG